MTGYILPGLTPRALIGKKDYEIFDWRWNRKGERGRGVGEWACRPVWFVNTHL